MTISMVLEDIKSDSGLINDPAAAARNRQNIDRMRKLENDLGVNGRAYTTVFIKQRNDKCKENITQEVKKVMPTGIVVPDSELEKQKDAIIADAAKLNQVQLLRKYKIGCARWAELRKKWGVKDKKRGGNHHRKDETKAAAGETTTVVQPTANSPAPAARPVLPGWNENWSDPVKLAWFNAFSNLR